MIPKPPECVGCELYSRFSYPNGLQAARKGFTRPEGTGSLGVLIVGESSGEWEEKTGLPFRPFAQAGSVLERAIRKAGYNRQQFRIANVLSCRPPNDYLAGAPWELTAIQHCSVHREKIIREMRPKVILALGEIAFRTLTGMAGKKQTITHLRGYPIMTQWGLVVGSFHPSYLKRGNMNLLGTLIHDIQKAVSLVNQQEEDPPLDYHTPDIKEAKGFLESLKREPETIVAYDIETPYTADQTEEEYSDLRGEIISIQFSCRVGYGLYFPWIDTYINIAKEILALPNTKIGHNVWRFDNPKLLQNGCDINGGNHDTMWAFHHLQPDLSGLYNLQSVSSFYGMPAPWKHLAQADPEGYGCSDVDAVQRIWKKLPQQMKEKGVWEGYERQVLGLEPVLVGMSKRGIPVNNEARLELEAKLEEKRIKLFEDMQQIFPDELKGCRPKEGYKKPPKAVTKFIDDPTKGIFWTKEGYIEGFDSKYVKEKYGFDYIQRNFRDKAGGDVVRWCKLIPFKPSSKQVLKYIKWRGHPVPKLTKEDKETSEQKGLEKLVRTTGDPLYGAILEYRGIEKIISTYVRGWDPGVEGRVHPEFLYRPATGQLSSINPNCQNAPAGKTKEKEELAKAFRRIVEAPSSSYKLIEFDWKSFHVMTLGFESRDPLYMRMARLDMHSFFTATGLLKLEKPEKLIELPDEEYLEWARWFRSDPKKESVRNDKGKPTILAVVFGEGANRLWKENEETIENRGEAEKLLATLRALFPKPFKWQQDIVKLAFSKGHYLVSRFGYIRWFWDIGEHANRAKAFFPANDAFGMKKEVMLSLHIQRLDEKYGLINEIHDSLMFCCPATQVEECISVVREMMEAPSKVLIDPEVAPQGLSVGVEVKVGQDWSNMQKVHNGG